MHTTLPPISDIWVYLSGSPLLALVLTLSAYWLGLTIYERSQRNPLANPVLIAVVLVTLSISGLEMPYAKYFEGAQFVHFLLGTATVALAIPIYKGLASLKGRMGVLLLSLVAGGLTSAFTAVGMARWLGVDEALVRGLVAKSVTAPIAMGIAERVQASPTLTAIFAVSTGILSRARALRAGCAAHHSLVATRLCAGCGRPRHWHLTCVQRERRSRRVCQLRDGTARHRGCAVDSLRGSRLVLRR